MITTIYVVPKGALTTLNPREINTVESYAQFLMDGERTSVIQTDVKFTKSLAALVSITGIVSAVGFDTAKVAEYCAVSNAPAVAESDVATFNEHVRKDAQRAEASAATYVAALGRKARGPDADADDSAEMHFDMRSAYTDDDDDRAQEGEGDE